jgi:hypothetical protein
MIALALLVAIAANPERPDLDGRVLDGAGKPISGVRVLIYTAAARVGVNPYCPSCYADCAKSADTGERGQFTIRSLDPNLIFQVLVIGDRFVPTFVDNVDPIRGPIEVVVRPIDPKRLDPRYSVRGRVFDPEGKPVIGAKLTPINFRTEEWKGFSPGIIDPVAVSDLSGEYILTSRSPVEYVSVKVEARGLAPEIFSKLSADSPAHQLKLNRGVSVTGLVTRDGKPLPGVVLGLVQMDRGSDSYLGNMEIATDASGRFLFSNVSSHKDYYVYGLMDSFKAFGCLAAVQMSAKDEGTTNDLGELKVVPGHRLAGRILLSDGKPLPAHTRVLLSRDQAWDSQIVELDDQGRFASDGLPTEVYSVSSQIKGYKLSPKNDSASPVNTYLLEGMVDRDIIDLRVLFEPVVPGDEKRTDWNDPDFRRRVKAFLARRTQLIVGVKPDGAH